MTRQAIDRGAQLVLWPESSTPFYFEEARDRADADRLRALAQAGAGPDSHRQRPDRATACRRSIYNSAFLVREDGSTGGVYRKMHLVPFGEYVPFKRVLFFAAPLVEAVSDFSAGDEPVAAAGRRTSDQHGDLLRDRLSQSGPPVRHGGQRAADDDHQRRVVRQDVGAVPAFRAGLDARDRRRALSGPVRQHRHQRHRRSRTGACSNERTIYEPAVLVGEARFLRTTTLYTRIGDVVAYASVVVTLALVVLSRRRIR